MKDKTLNKKDILLIIGEDEIVADKTFGMNEQQVAKMDKELDTIGCIKRNQLRALQRERLERL